MLTLLTLVVMISKVTSQTSSDSCTCIPNSQLRIAARLIEVGKADSVLVIMQDSTIAQLHRLLAARENELSAYKNREQIYNKIVANYDTQISLMKDQGVISASWVKDLQKQVRRGRTKTVLVGLAGLVVSGVTLYLTTR